MDLWWVKHSYNCRKLTLAVKDRIQEAHIDLGKIFLSIERNELPYKLPSMPEKKFDDRAHIEKDN